MSVLDCVYPKVATHRRDGEGGKKIIRFVTNIRVKRDDNKFYLNLIQQEYEYKDTPETHAEVYNMFVEEIHKFQHLLIKPGKKLYLGHSVSEKLDPDQREEKERLHTEKQLKD